jgi:N-methylhydantoinase B
MSTATFDAVSLAVMSNALIGIAEEMGTVLVRGAYSSNIKERRDCSTALFDANGACVAQAAHVPVHLGALPGAVAAVIELGPEPGDVFILNDPYRGGSHLPDVTLVSPVEIEGRVLAYAASRCHHAEVGGMAPGSMPSGAREIIQEGIIIPPVRIVRGGQLVADLLDLITANVRTPHTCRGDLRAQIAAGAVAQTRLRELASRHGADTVLTAFDAVIAYAERRVRALIAGLPDGTYVAETALEGDGITDDDVPIRAAVTIRGDQMSIDFAGTAPAVAGNVNTPLAVTRSACSFALRTLLDADVPTNAGSECALEVSAPPGSLVDARWPSAVAAGNVETSQRIADTVLAALSQIVDVGAEGQGTMNNLIIGAHGWSYYETIGGGQGASRHGPGDSGVHVGMTNTLNTPIEALELEYPLRVERYELTGGRGGSGHHRGGDGIERSLRVLEPATLSLLTDRRRHAPRGSHGGADGACGANLLNGEPLGAKVTRALRPGDVVTVRTPGGGGWGARSRPATDQEPPR